MQTKSVGIFLLLFTITVALAGCAGSNAEPKFHGPSAPPQTRTEPWSFGDDAGVVIHSDHYDIYTTVPDPDVRRRMAEVMEGAFGEYQRVAPGVPVSSKPMDCYIFANREEWVEYTRRHTGADAYIYLQISRGGYTVRDWYAGYYLGSTAATMSVAAHEGWHQFASRNFKGRLPPFLEEGIATMFEDIEWDNNLPEWNLSMNRSRLQSLRAAVEGNYLYPLPELSQKHAGNVVAQSGNRVEAFYGENWAFATFLWTGEDRKYRPQLRKLISDIADGTVYDPTGIHQDKNLPWNSAGVRPMLEHYLGMNLDAIDVQYQKFIRKVAFDDYAAQWN